MKKKHEINIIQKKEGHINDYGGWIEGTEEIVRTINVDVQPYSREQFIKDYGYDVEVTKRIFSELDEEITIATTIVYKNEYFEVKKIIEWDNHMELMINGL